MNKATVVATTIMALALMSIDSDAQINRSPSSQLPLSEEQPAEKRQISKKKLPEPIKQALKSEVLAMWDISEVYKVTPASGKLTYEVYFKNEDNMRGIARFDEDGNTLTEATQELTSTN
ncbi:hypothetical protein ACXYMU_16255 [Pontibacter sp. CAU 1760]